MRRSLFLTIVALFAMTSVSHAQVSSFRITPDYEKQSEWFLSGSLQANIASVDGESASSASLGVGIHRMLGDKFSAGVGLFYLGSEGSNAVETDLMFAYYGRLADRFYYVPEVSVGIGYFTELEIAGAGGAVSPFGLEFRPTDRLGFRVNIVNFTYFNLEGSNFFNFGIDPSLSVIVRF